MPNRRRTRHGERGQAMVEFAIASVIVFTLLFGVIDFGEAMFAYDLVTNAARIGTRWAMVRGSTCTGATCPATTATVQSYVQSKSPGLSSPLVVTTYWSKGGAACTDSTYHGPGCLVSVVVQYPFRFFYKLPAITLTSTSQMVISQ